MSRAVLTTHPDKPGRVAVRFPFDRDINERLKDHGGHWDPAPRKVWHIPEASIAAVVAILESEFGMKVIDDTRLANRQSPQSSVVVDRVQFYEAMFARLPEDDRRAKYRDLMRAFHPDACGDPAEATAINVAFDRVKNRTRKGA